MDNKKISIEIAISVIILVAIIIGGIFYFKSKKEIPVTAQTNQAQTKSQKVENKQIAVAQKSEVQSGNQQNQIRKNNKQQLQASQGSSEKTNKYINKTFGFQFEFPKSLFITQDSTDSDFGLSKKPDGHWDWECNISVSANKDNLSLNQAFDRILERYKDSDKKIVTTNINIGGKEAKRYSIQNPTDIGNTAAAVIYEGNIIVIRGDDFNADSNSIFETVINSLEFTK